MRVPNSTQSYFRYYSTVATACQGSVLVHTPLLFFEHSGNLHADAFSSPKQTILQRKEINTENQLQLNYYINIHLLIQRFMKSLCVITIKLNIN